MPRDAQGCPGMSRDVQGCPGMPRDARFWIQPSVNNPPLSTGNAQHLLSPLKLSQREKKKSCHHPPLPQAPPGCDVCVLQTGRDAGDGFLLEGDSCNCHCLDSYYSSRLVTDTPGSPAEGPHLPALRFSGFIASQTRPSFSSMCLSSHTAVVKQK